MNGFHIPPQVLNASVSSQFFKELCSKFTGEAGLLGAIVHFDFDGNRLSKRTQASIYHKK